MPELGQIDPNLNVPPAVRAAAQRAADAQKQFMEGIPPTEELRPIEESAAAPQVVEEPIKPKAEAPKEEPVTEPGKDSWEHKFKSLKGRFDHATNTIREQSATIDALQNQLDELRERIENPAQPRERLLTDEEETEYGTDFLNVVAKKAKEELSPEVAAMRKEIDKLNEKLKKVNTTSSVSAREQLLNTLEAQVPNWAAMNEDDDFIGWLQLPDPYSGAIRHELLKQAFDRNDTRRVLAFFNGFLAEEAAVDPARRGPELNAAPEAAGKLSLEEYAAPGRAKTAATGQVPTEKPSFTRAQIAKFYIDVTAGKYRGREKDKAKLEAQIFDAEREGRIR